MALLFYRFQVKLEFGMLGREVWVWVCHWGLQTPTLVKKKKPFILLPCLGYYFSRFVTEVGSLLFRFISKGSFIHVGLQQVTTVLEISVSEAFIFSWLQGLRCKEENKKQNKNYCLFYQCVNFWKHWITKGILGFNNSCRLRFPWWIKSICTCSVSGWQKAIISLCGSVGHNVQEHLAERFVANVDQSNIHYGHCWLCFAVITVACFKCWLCPFVAAHSTSYSPYGCGTSSTCCLIKLPWFSFTCHSLCMIIIGSRLVMKHLSTQRPLSVFYFCLRIAETFFGRRILLFLFHRRKKKTSPRGAFILYEICQRASRKR